MPLPEASHSELKGMPRCSARGFANYANVSAGFANSAELTLRQGDHFRRFRDTCRVSSAAPTAQTTGSGGVMINLVNKRRTHLSPSSVAR